MKKGDELRNKDEMVEMLLKRTNNHAERLSSIEKNMETVASTLVDVNKNIEDLWDKLDSVLSGNGDDEENRIAVTRKIRRAITEMVAALDHLD